jgi:hypothetical protein
MLKCAFEVVSTLLELNHVDFVHEMLSDKINDRVKKPGADKDASENDYMGLCVAYK